MATPSITEFRTTFPEFADDSIYSDDQVTIWLTFAQQMVDECRWDTLFNLGCYLVTAHNLVLSARDQAAAEAGGTPGEMTGSISGKSVDRVSVSYSDTTTLPGAGAWNLTAYGVRYKTMARMFGIGGLVI